MFQSLIDLSLYVPLGSDSLPAVLGVCGRDVVGLDLEVLALGRVEVEAGEGNRRHRDLVAGVEVLRVD